MAPSNTFFEQIPVETVKRIAAEFSAAGYSEKKPIGSDGHNPGGPEESRSPRERWRELAKKTQEEKDPKRITELVEQLIAQLDEEQLRKRPPLRRDAIVRSD